MEKMSSKIHTILSRLPQIAAQSAALSQSFDIVVFSHLRWEFVFQRPQHIMERLGKDRQIIFVEEPIAFDYNNRGTAREVRVSSNITVLQPRISTQHYTRELTPLLQKVLKRKGIIKPVLWFYSGNFVEMVEVLPHQAIVYDCMDELSAFKGASPALIENEKKLLRMADIVFTGGKSLYEAKKKYHSNVYCFPSSVDRTHFAKALRLSTSVPSDLLRIPQPRVGFYGVVDERLDTQLLKEVAHVLPDTSFVVIGPVVKISPGDLPQAPNLYYLGGRSYQVLPQYLKGFDIAMMPFALNQATKFISPTKTLEFMAALKPIVSTPIYDVLRDYQHETKIVTSAEEWKTAILSYLYETRSERKKRIQLQKTVIKKTSWDRTVQSMKKIVNEYLQPSTQLESSLSIKNVPSLAAVGLQV